MKERTQPIRNHRDAIVDFQLPRSAAACSVMGSMQRFVLTQRPKTKQRQSLLRQPDQGQDGFAERFDLRRDANDG